MTFQNKLNIIIITIIIIISNKASPKEESVFDIIDKEENIIIEPEQEEMDLNEYDIDIKPTIESELHNNNKIAEHHKNILIRILNRPNNTVESHKIRTGSHIDIGTITIYPKLCVKDLDNSKALIEVRHKKMKDISLFNSWIFSNYPSLSVFEHPIYNITLLDCI